MRVSVTRVEWIEVNREARKRIAKCEAEGLCCACLQPLDQTRVIRGCHYKCAKATYRAILAGKCTDEERVKEGKWLEHGKTGRKPSNPVSVELNES